MLTATAPEQEKMDAINTLAFRVAELERAVSGSVDEAENIDEARNIFEDLIQEDDMDCCGDPECITCFPDGQADDVLTDGDLLINTLLGHVVNEDPGISLAAIDQYIRFILSMHDRELIQDEGK